MEFGPVVIDTRPWVARKLAGEIPHVPGISFLDLFATDKESGAWILKEPEILRELFE